MISSRKDSFITRHSALWAKKKKEDEVEEKKNMKMKTLNKELKVEKTMNKNEEYRINWRTMNKVKKEVQATWKRNIKIRTEKMGERDKADEERERKNNK